MYFIIRVIVQYGFILLLKLFQFGHWELFRLVLISFSLTLIIVCVCVCEREKERENFLML